MIPCIFPSINPNSVIGSSDYSTVEVFCNPEASSDLFVVDFNGIIAEKELITLFKTLTLLSSIHVLNVSLKDFKEKTFEPSREIKMILEWYNEYYSKNKKINKTFLLVLVRDIDEDDPNAANYIKRVEDSFEKIYFKEYVRAKTVVNLRECEDKDSSKCGISEVLVKILDNHLKKDSSRKKRLSNLTIDSIS